MKKSNMALLLLTAGDLIQQVGIHFLTVAIAAYTYEMTGSAWAYALQQLLMFLPWMLFPGIAGPIVDRLDRRKVMVVAAIVRGLIQLCYPYVRTIEPVLVLNFMGSVCGVFVFTARTALIPLLAEKDGLLRVNGLRTAAFGCIDMIVPILAGAVMGWMGTTAAFRLVSLTMVAGAIAFATIPRSSAHAEQPQQARQVGGFARDLRVATSFLKGQPALIGAIAVYTIYSAGQNGTNALFYPYVTSVLHGGTAVFGLSISFYFGANFLAGLLLARFGKVLSRVPVVALAAPAAMIWLLYPEVRAIPVILVMGFTEGIIMSLLSTLYMTDVQARSPKEMTGRVWGVASSINGGGQVFGILLAGTIAGRRGPLVAYWVCGGLIFILLMATEAYRRSAVRRETQNGLVTLSGR